MLRFLLLLLLIRQQISVEINVDTNRVIRAVDEKFVSVAVDTNIMMKHWLEFQPWSAKVHTLAKALSPSYLRFGGTDADTLLFDDGLTVEENLLYRKKSLSPSNNKTGPNASLVAVYANNFPDTLKRSKRDIGYIYPGKRDYTNFTMTGHLYDELHKFVSAANFDLVFDLNELLRDGKGWYPGDAYKLMEYTAKQGYKVAGWELGNEPNAYYHQWGRHIEPQQLAADFKTMKQMAYNFTAFQNGIILGPSTTQLNKHRTIEYFQDFLQSGGGNVVTCVCFHQYYVNGRTATKDQFTDPAILNSLGDEITIGYNIKNKTAKNTQLWLGETASAWGGGAKGLSDRYVAGFMWLDKLGLAARLGVDVVVRQSFYGGHYALLETHSHNPRPDYWLTLVYKKLVGRKVLSVLSPSFKGKLRAYAHCVNAQNYGYKQGGVVVYAMNLNNYNVSLTFPSLSHRDLSRTDLSHNDLSQRNVSHADLSHGEDVYVYLLEPENGDLQSRTVLLNGTPLKMLSHTELPPLLPRRQKQPVSLPALTFGFFVIPGANTSACL